MPVEKMHVISLEGLKEEILLMEVGEEGDFYLAAYMFQKEASLLARELNEKRGVGRAWITPVAQGVCQWPLTHIHVRIPH